MAGRRAGAAALACVFFCALGGCGMPATPLPPSLRLPRPVKDLSAVRTGDVVALQWTMPKRDTSNVDLKPHEAVQARICRAEGSQACAAVAELAFLPGAAASFSETLSPVLAGGAPRALRYSVELLNRRGRSAGLSNPAMVLAGAAPAAVAGLSAKVRKNGVVVLWTPGPAEPYPTRMRLKRTLLTPPPAKTKPGPLEPAPEPAVQNLLVPAGGVRGVALDKDIRFGESYAYQAQRVAQLTVDGKELELDGPFSPPVRVDAMNVFAPDVPTGLVAVATPAANGAGLAIDLSWQPDAENDLAGYAVYRRKGAGGWQRISGAQPVVGPGFHDAGVVAGHTYRYAVTALGENGRESARSEPAEETVPEP